MSSRPQRIPRELEVIINKKRSEVLKKTGITTSRTEILRASKISHTFSINEATPTTTINSITDITKKAGWLWIKKALIAYRTISRIHNIRDKGSNKCSCIRN